MAYICNKPKGACATCFHLRYDEDSGRQSCWANYDQRMGISEVKVGDMIQILDMRGEMSYTNKVGTITKIDDRRQIHGTWGGCAVLPGVDKYKLIRKGN